MTPVVDLHVGATHRDGSGHVGARDRIGAGDCQAARCVPSSRALAARFAHAILAGRLVVFEATVDLRSEYLAVLAAVDMRLTRYFFLWVIDVKRVLVRGTTFEVRRF